MIEYIYCKECEVANRQCKHALLLNTAEVKDLYDFLTQRAGYISREFDLGTHELWQRLDKYVKGV